MNVNGYTLSANPPEGLTLYSPEFLAKQPTIATGQADDLRLDTGGLRYWTARCSPEDGEEWEVHVERFRGGRWEPLLSYRKAA